MLPLNPRFAVIPPKDNAREVEYRHMGNVWLDVEAAEAAWGSMREQGRELHFETDPRTGRLSITERDLDGNVLRSVSALETLEIASSGVEALSCG
jgi:hypothetical protein